MDWRKPSIITIVKSFYITISTASKKIKGDDDKIKTHKIKLSSEFADDVLAKRKTFEIRLNDRDYRKGDHIIFEVVSPTSEPYRDWSKHPLNSKEYEITYVLRGWGLKEGYVAFAIKETAANI